MSFLDENVKSSVGSVRSNVRRCEGERDKEVNER